MAAKDKAGVLIDPKSDGTIRASVHLDTRAWKATRAAAEILDMSLTDFIHEALEMNLRAHKLPLADFWIELAHNDPPLFEAGQ